jgi:hypothetical protein
MADLSGFSASAKQAEVELVRYITGGAAMERYASVEEFLVAN